MMGKSIKLLKDPALISKTLDCFNGKYQIRHFSLLKVSVTVGIEIEYFLQHKKLLVKVILGSLGYVIWYSWSLPAMFQLYHVY
jgi:hypothetical protein